MSSIIIVEGKSDTRRLKEVFEHVITFETSGLGLDELKIEKLKKLNESHDLIVFTDPDGPGEKIRAKLNANLPNLAHAYLPNDKALSKNKTKIGVEHASSEDIKTALKNLYYQSEKRENYEVGDLVDFNIYANKNKRILFCDKLHIAFGNNKKVLEQLNTFSISRDIVNNVVEEINGSSE